MLASTVLINPNTMTTSEQFQQDKEFLLKWSEVCFLQGEDYDRIREEAIDVIRRMKEYKRLTQSK